MKVLGTKVTDEFYIEFVKLGIISTHLRKAAQLYLESKVNRTLTTTEPIISEDEYQSIHTEVDRFLSHLKEELLRNKKGSEGRKE